MGSTRIVAAVGASSRCSAGTCVGLSGVEPLTHAPDRRAGGAVLQPDCQPRNRPHSIVDDTADRVRAVPGAARDSVPHWSRVVSRAPAGWTQRHTRTLRGLRSLGRHNRRFYEPFPWASFQDHPKRVQPPNSGAVRGWRVLGSNQRRLSRRFYRWFLIAALQPLEGRYSGGFERALPLRCRSLSRVCPAPQVRQWPTVALPTCTTWCR
jgi:hypothetical protein